MSDAGTLKVSPRGQMSLPAAARHRWTLDDGGQVSYLDLGDVLLVLPQSLESLRRELVDAVPDEVWAQANPWFGDPDLATQ